MVEIEIGVLRTQCLNRRIDTRESLVAEVHAWRQQRNASGARIKWTFTTHGARAKLAGFIQDRRRVVITVQGDQLHSLDFSSLFCLTGVRDISRGSLAERQ